MFQFIGDILGMGFFFSLGWWGFYKPYHCVGVEGTAAQVKKRVRQSKRFGLMMMIGSIIMLIAFVAEHLTGK
jgi:hypothetical protein